MYAEMVLKNEHATSVRANASNSEYDGQFSVSATAREVKNAPVVGLDQLEKELWAYLEDAKTNPCDEQLLQRVKNQVEARYLQSLQGTGIAGQLARNARATII